MGRIKIVLLVIAWAIITHYCMPIPMPFWFLSIPVYWFIGYLVGKEIDKL